MSPRAALNSRPPCHASAVSSHPRRRPACDSVSLRHSTVPRAHAQIHALSAKFNTACTPTASSLVNNSGSPAGSSASQTWFDTSNNNPVLPHKTSQTDHEPPFFLPESSSDTPHKSNSHEAPSVAQPFFPPGPWHRDTTEGSLDDFRSVIDDLTVQNKALLRRLRKYEQANHRHLHSERLFEVKIHGLPARKKHELEDMLKRFALGLNNVSPSNESNDASAALAAQQPNAPKPSSSLSSTKFADSGYGSMTNSVHRTTHLFSSNSANSNAQSSNGIEASRARDRSIHSYLHDIPEGLLPRDSPTVMTEDAKKRLIVLRLERLFHGSGAATGGHQQPMQQQEVSQIAAKDDRSALEARGQRAQAEGKREAPIMEEASSSIPGAASLDDKTALRTNDDRRSPGPIADGHALEQRPTRPLDLDPHRAQNPVENVNYIRHLGFTMPDSSSATGQNDTHGWIYLNLLINLAQLHTLNVTTQLIQDALRTHSSQFELSHDGRKIRWRPNMARIGSATEQSYPPDRLSETGMMSDASTAAGRKRPRPSYLEALPPSQYGTLIPKKQAVSGETPTLSPSTFCVQSSERNGGDDGDTSMQPDESENLLPSVAEYDEDSSLDPMDAIMSRSSITEHDGSLVFFNNPRFFLDLSGDRSRQPRAYGQSYSCPVNSQPLGIASPQRNQTDETMIGEVSPIITAPSVCGSLEVNTDMKEMGGNDEVHFFSDTGSHSDLDRTASPFQLDASGVGCVYPSDNFVLYVSRDCGRLPALKTLLNTTPGSPVSAPRSLPARPPSKKPKIVHIQRNQLSPAELPPAAFAVTPDDEDLDDSDEEDDDMEISVSMEEDTRPKSSQDPSEDTSQDASPYNTQAISSSNPERVIQRDAMYKDLDSTYASPEDDQEDAQSLDFLATAREVDPVAVIAREREYDAEMAERLAEEIPPGSSAATRGGGRGSGYNSPAEADVTGLLRRVEGSKRADGDEADELGE